MHIHILKSEETMTLEKAMEDIQLEECRKWSRGGNGNIFWFPSPMNSFDQETIDLRRMPLSNG